MDVKEDTSVIRYRLLARIRDDYWYLDLELNRTLRQEYPELFDMFGLPEDADSIILEPEDPRIKEYNHIAYQKFGRMYNCESEEDFEFKGYITEPLIREMDNGENFVGGKLWKLKKTQV